MNFNDVSIFVAYFFESRKYTLFFISAGYHIFSLTIMGIIIAAFAS